MVIILYDYRRCDGYVDLYKFLGMANQFGYEIIGFTESKSGTYTVVYKDNTGKSIFQKRRRD